MKVRKSVGYARLLAAIQSQVKSQPAAGEFHLEQILEIARKEGASSPIGNQAVKLAREIRFQPDAC